MKFLPIIFLLLLPFSSQAQSQSDKPNIVFIFADDQCFDTISALGHREVKTPNLDRLVNNGTTFTHCYNMGAWGGAVCVASRTMLNTGRFVWNSRKFVRSDFNKKQSWGHLMGQAGYATYMSGKWHVNGGDPSKAFQNTVHIRPGMPNQTEAGYNRPQSYEDNNWKPWDKKFGGFWQGGKHWSEVLAEDSLSFIKKAATKDQPFFMYLAFNAPHDPRQAPKSYVDMYPLDTISIPPNFMTRNPYFNAMGLGIQKGSKKKTSKGGHGSSAGKILRDERLAPMPRTEYSIKVNRQEYYALISHLDTQVGRVLDAIEKSGKADNTYIFFTADHGLAVGQHGLLGKQSMFDHSVRSPFMVVGPGITKNKRINERIYLQDVMPTTLEIAGANKPTHVDFKSLMPLIKGKEVKHYDAIYGSYMNYQRMVTVGNHKLIWYPKANKFLLFDLKDDPWEMNDLSEEKTMEVKVKELKKILSAKMKKLGDSLKL